MHHGELKTFKKIDTHSNIIEKRFEYISSKVKDFMINLQKLKRIYDNFLKLTVGIIIKNRIYTKVKGTIAKNFQRNDPA